MLSTKDDSWVKAVEAPRTPVPAYTARRADAAWRPEPGPTESTVRPVGVIRLLESLTYGRFTDGAVARILIAEFWTRGEAPTFAEFAQAWTAATRGAPELLAPEYAYLTDRQKHRAGADWKAVRRRNAAAALTMLDDILR